MDITTTITGDRAVALRLEKMPDDIHNRLVGAVTALTARLLSRVQASEPKRTGRLASETKSFVDEAPDLVRGRVKVTAPGARGELGKAAALEYGAHKPTQVREHTARLSHIFGRAIAPMEVIVDRYQRTPNITADRFLRGPLAQMKDQIMAELQKAVDQGVNAP